MKCVSSMIVPCNCHICFTLAKNATKPNIFEIISLQTTRKKNNWKTEETLARTVVTLETQRIKGSSPWCLWWWIVTFYLKCLDRVVLAHPFWAMATFPVCFSVLSCWTNRAPSMGTKWSSWVWRKHTICKKKYMYWVMIILCQWDFNEQIAKLVRLLLYTSENCSRKFHAWTHFVLSQ
jgi:hypothetical protein